MIPSSVSFQLWRNGATGSSAAKNFAILSSVGGFSTSAVLAQATYTDFGTKDNFASVQHTLVANLPTVADALDGPIEYRLYAWGATSTIGNTHINAASLSAKFVAVSSLEFNFAGVQDGAPLTALKRQDANITLTSGLSFGPGVAPRGANNVGNEFNVAGFSTGTSLQSAVDGNDYLTFSVAPVAGMAMYPDSVSFSLWRQGSGSATDYAVMSSIAGFAPGQQVARAHLTTTGAGNTLAPGGPFLNSQPTTNPVEFRLYGWNAATDLDDTHVVAASMRARFASLAGTTVNPTGSLTVQGDFYHLSGGILTIDLGGNTAGVDYDTVNVLGKVDLEGDLSVTLADTGAGLFAPALGNMFAILTATQGITGQFANVSLPQLSADYQWRTDYLPNAVTLTVLSAGDFNQDGVVDSRDYIVWRSTNGSQADYDIWRSHFGISAGVSFGSSLSGRNTTAVPEPAGVALLLCGVTIANFRRRRTRI